MTDKILNICRQFKLKGDLISVETYGDGHINDTYKITCRCKNEEHEYVLQRINHDIFKETHMLMDNIEKVTSYLRNKIEEESLETRVLTLVKTKSDKVFHRNYEGEYYRVYEFIKDSIGYTFTENNDLLYQAGLSFGEFQLLLKDFPVHELGETIVDFHHSEKRYLDFLKTYHENPLGLNTSCQNEIDFVMEREPMVDTITSKLESGLLPTRVTHNDTKLNNVLMDSQTDKAICVIDLDTVMPGSALYDFGDAIRSCGSTVAEDEENIDLLEFDMARFKAFTGGFLGVMKDELTDEEIRLLPHAAILMTFECGLRFLKDHLEGDVYFKVHKPNHNLIRARNQFRFVEVMESQIDEMRQVIKEAIQ